MTTSDNVVKYKPDYCPWDVVHGRSWRDGASTVEDDREVDILDDRVWPLARNEPSNDRCDSTNEEEEDEAAAGNISTRFLEVEFL